MKGSVREYPKGSGIFTGIIFQKMFLPIYDTNLPEILHKYCLDLSEELLLGLVPKYPEFPEKFRNLYFSGTFHIVRNFGNFRNYMYKY